MGSCVVWTDVCLKVRGTWNGGVVWLGDSMIDVLRSIHKDLLHCHQFYRLPVFLLQHSFAASGAKIVFACVFRSVKTAFRNPAFIHLL